MAKLEAEVDVGMVGSSRRVRRPSVTEAANAAEEKKRKEWAAAVKAGPDADTPRSLRDVLKEEKARYLVGKHFVETKLGLDAFNPPEAYEEDEFGRRTLRGCDVRQTASRSRLRSLGSFATFAAWVGTDDAEADDAERRAAKVALATAETTRELRRAVRRLRRGVGAKRLFDEDLFAAAFVGDALRRNGHDLRSLTTRKRAEELGFKSLSNATYYYTAPPPRAVRPPRPLTLAPHTPGIFARPAGASARRCC